ncbi:MAG TPA: hypothetical protein ENN75_00510 [candidate division Zixibacteria bacterium]|nr:hypothetical protein [candidate division Zixibacteria bacterium]
MRRTYIAILFLMIITLAGCAKTYYGRHVTAKVKQEPVEEFKAGDYAVLSFENQKKIGAEGWLWEFWVYYQNKLYFKYYLQTRVVAGTRNYYLIEEIPGARSSTIASFTAKPNYDRTKDRLISNLTDKGSPRAN